MFTSNECRTIISLLPEQFDSHDFIKMGAIVATLSFLDLVKKYDANFTKIDSQVGQFLMRQSNGNKLPLNKDGETESETIIGTKSICALWRKL